VINPGTLRANAVKSRPKTRSLSNNIQLAAVVCTPQRGKIDKAKLQLFLLPLDNNPSASDDGAVSVPVKISDAVEKRPGEPDPTPAPVVYNAGDVILIPSYDLTAPIRPGSIVVLTGISNTLWSPKDDKAVRMVLGRADRVSAASDLTIDGVGALLLQLNDEQDASLRFLESSAEPADVDGKVSTTGAVKQNGIELRHGGPHLFPVRARPRGQRRGRAARGRR